MRVLLISHSCIHRNDGQPRAAHLAGIPGVELQVLIPDRWFQYGGWRAAERPDPETFTCRVGKVLWPWSGPGQWYLHWYPELASLLKDFRPDIIDLWEEPWGLVSAHACWLRNRLLPRTGIVVETEQNINKTLPFPFEAFRSYTLRNANYAIGRNQAALEVLRSKGYSGPAETVPNAVDAALFRPLDRAECRKKLEISGFVVGYFGRLVEEKGLMDLVDALPFCPPETRLLFVGSGPLQGAIEARARELGKTDRLWILPARPLEELPHLMNALDVLVLPSRTTARWKEQFGRVIIEAHACRIPVIGSDSGAIPDVVGRGGLIVPERNPRALAAAIAELANRPEVPAELGRIGRTQVEAGCTWERVALRLHSIYRRTLTDTYRLRPVIT
jgi:glycosyltransferase involved in cell wall biosynthesis